MSEVQRLSFHDQIQKNKIKSVALIIGIFILFILIGYLISIALDPSFFFIIMIFATIFSLAYVLITYYKSHNIALASVRAKPADKTEHRMLFHAAESMSIASGLPRPKLYVMPGNQINAFASGRNPKNSVICFSQGAVDKLDKQELEGVMAHEMSHIANYDIRFMTLVAIMVGLISIIAQIYLRSLFFSSLSGNRDRDDKTGVLLIILSIVAAILAPIIAHLISLAVSRKREFAADATGVKFTRYPSGLSSALKKIKSEHLPSEKEKKQYPQAVAPLFISDPFKKKVKGMFATHPNIDERISRLERM
ncbi:zinc metalloprotease HtpX [Candidatus Pacearchaeota archaeon]|nr:zinc metalloprotease HtpX [Candidatus Pacearchaeota archaeon]|tara:strand:+ start:5450 stop:6370 length:921 start_codon:yes stop_codon:yes gene_type:complete